MGNVGLYIYIYNMIPGLQKDTKYSIGLFIRVSLEVLGALWGQKYRGVEVCLRYPIAK